MRRWPSRPTRTLGGAASDGFTTHIATKVPLCAGAPVHAAAAGGFDYGPSPLPGWWRVAPAPDQTEAAQAFAAAAGVEDAVVPPPEGGLDERLAALLEAPLAAAANDTLAGLPLVDLPVTTPGRLMAVVYSGDGGWRDIDKDIAGRLQEKGVPVVGVDSLRYFWSEKTPERDRRRPRPDHRPLPRDLAAARGDSGRLLVRRRHTALRLQPAAARERAPSQARTAWPVPKRRFRDPRHRLARRGIARRARVRPRRS